MSRKGRSRASPGVAGRRSVRRAPWATPVLLDLHAGPLSWGSRCACPRGLCWKNAAFPLGHGRVPQNTEGRGGPWSAGSGDSWRAVCSWPSEGGVRMKSVEVRVERKYPVAPVAVSSQRCDVAQPELAVGPEVSLRSAEGAVRLQDRGALASAASGRHPMRLPVHVTPGARRRLESRSWV